MLTPEADRSPAAPAPRSRSVGESVRERAELLLLAVVIAAQLLPLVALPYLPTQDGPSHQALAYALRVLDRPDRPEGAPLRAYLVHNAEALPNWFVFFLQSKALVFLPVLVAEKVLVAAYVVLLPLALRYALRGVDRAAGFLAILATPITYNYLFAMGFLNFCWSLAAFLFGLGLYLRRGERFGARDAVTLAALAAWVYVCHPVALVMLLLAVVALGGIWAMLDARAAGWSAAALGHAARTRLLWPLVAFAPVFVLLVSFVGKRFDHAGSRLSLAVKVKHLAGLYSLVSFDRRTIAFALALALLLAVLTAAVAWQRRRARAVAPTDALLVVVALFVLVDLVAPSDLAGGGFLNHRLALFPPLALLLWLGSGQWGRTARLATQAVGMVLALGVLAMLWTRWAAIDELLGEAVATAEHVEDGHTVLPLAFAPAGDPFHPSTPAGKLAFRVRPFVHAVGYVAGHRPIVDLGLYEAAEDYFPLRFRPAIDPYRHLSVGPLGMEEIPPRVDIAGYERQGGRVDYVLLWQPPVEPRRDGAEEVYRQLATFERVYVSRRGNAELWRRRAR